MNKLPFSALQRHESLQKIQDTSFDLVVIGGGITGAGIALDAATRGMKVALIEKQDFASGTSSKSTKLIHGGLRYLKQLEIKLVRETGTERAIIHTLAPHLVLPEKMLLPLVEGGSYGKLATSFGLRVYDVLASVKGKDRRKMLSKKNTLLKEPLLKEEGLLGSGYYAEYRTDDARLTIENLKTAANHGAVCLNYLSARDFIYEDGQVIGLRCADQISQESVNIQSKFVISAAGPWVDQLRKINQSLQGKHLFHSKGVHIVVPHEALPVQQSVYFDVPDGRMIFAIPRQRVTYIGTTDTEYKGDLNRVFPSLEDVAYLLQAVNFMFPSIHLKLSDVESSWAGLRPLIHEEGKSPSEMSRKDEVFEAENGLISIAGGKLTGYRKMAERVVDLVAKKYKEKYKQNFGKTRTDRVILSGGTFIHYQEVLDYTKALAQKLKPYQLADYAQYLVNNYGKQTETILQKLEQYPEKNFLNLSKAELWFTINYEMTHSLLDFYERRTGRLYFYMPSIRASLDEIIAEFQQYFNWDEDTIAVEKNQLLQTIQDLAEFKSEKELV